MPTIPTGILAVLWYSPTAPAALPLPMLRLLCTAWAERGWLAIRFDMPFRRNRPSGPPSASSADKDRAGIAEVINKARAMVDGPLLAGGHSYGGRQTSMLVAEKGPIVDVLTLFSYPLHPPGKPDRLRIEHLPDIQVPTVFTHGTSDAFGTIAELKEASVLIPAARPSWRSQAPVMTWDLKRSTSLRWPSTPH